jgi:cellulose synthase/poly-beta-1,6-N-acetylglucosamine synthase-like glycosyltransferase
MTILFFTLAAVLILFSFRSFRGGISFLRYVTKELARPTSSFTPFASVIVPCKGLDQGIEENLLALLEQDYPTYEVIFVVDDENDPAVSVIDKISQHHNHSRIKPKLVIAPKAVESAQKVENLREAVLHISDESRVFVFADSDARPPKDWLASLIAPLENGQIGVTTGYRWFISSRMSFASELRSAWNASIASALGPNLKSNFCWGGSTAIRRDVFERIDMREKWRGTLSDDFAVTRAIKAAGLAIYFVPKALIASVESCTFKELFEFTNRQMKITRVYAPQLWKLSFFGSGLFNVTLIWAAVILFTATVGTIPFLIAAVTVLLVAFFSIGKSWLRFAAVRLILGEYQAELRRQFIPQNTLWLLAPVVFLYNCVVAGLSRKMTWRNVQYQLVSASETKILGRTDGSKPHLINDPINVKID